MLAGQHGRLGSLYQQDAQAIAAALGDAAQTGLAATGGRLAAWGDATQKEASSRLAKAQLGFCRVSLDLLCHKSSIMNPSQLFL